MSSVRNSKHEDGMESVKTSSSRMQSMSGKKFAKSFLAALLGTIFFFAALTFLSSKASGFLGFWMLHYLIPAFMVGYLLNFFLNAIIDRFKKQTVN